ncbi:MAG TPA: hypothetical protein VN851_00210 [Thermoanaerobaculia bacterium]|nr:hypothetical protein [Thermoanaerobaculia bacterium]
MDAGIEDSRIKDLVKTAMIEVLEERRDLVLGLVEEALEDMGMVHAIREGEQSPLVSREEVFRILEK